MNGDVRRGVVLLEEQLRRQLVTLRIAMAPCDNIGFIHNDLLEYMDYTTSRGVSLHKAEICRNNVQIIRLHCRTNLCLTPHDSLPKTFRQAHLITRLDMTMTKHSHRWIKSLIQRHGDASTIANTVDRI